MARNTISRSMHDVGLAAWFGGTLANAVALNAAAAAQAGGSRRTGAVANVGWDRWTPVNAAAVAAHVVGSVGQLGANAGRLQTQRGVGTMALAKTALTAGALGAAAYSRILRRKVSKKTDVPAEPGTEPAPTAPDGAPTAPDGFATAQRRLAMLRWAVPALTGALVVVSAFAGEQQRAPEVKKGPIGRLLG